MELPGQPLMDMEGVKKYLKRLGKRERFLNINHLEATRLEKEYNWLPQVHHQHLIITHRIMLKLKNMFYIGCNMILFIAISAALFVYFWKCYFVLSFVVSIITFVIFLFLSRVMFVKAYKNELSSLKGMINVRER